MSSAAPLSKPNQLHSSEQLDLLLKRIGIKLCLKVSLKPLFLAPLAPWISSLIGLLISTSISNIRCLAVSFAAFKFSWVQRNCNSAANVAARLAFKLL